MSVVSEPIIPSTASTAFNTCIDFTHKDTIQLTIQYRVVHGRRAKEGGGVCSVPKGGLVWRIKNWWSFFAHSLIILVTGGYISRFKGRAIQAYRAPPCAPLWHNIYIGRMGRMGRIDFEHLTQQSIKRRPKKHTYANNNCKINYSNESVTREWHAFNVSLIIQTLKFIF